MNKIVLAIGGNAIIKEGQKGTIEEQQQNINESCEPVLKLVEQGNTVVITHGNGPQVGNSLIKSQMAESVIPNYPLDVLDAETEGNLGYLIQQAFKNKMTEKNINKTVATVITQSVVSQDDPAFENPTKPIGPFFTKEEADRISAEENVSFVEDSGRGYRRVVASPKPTRIVEKEAIEALLEKDITVVTAGGGGIPVIEENGMLKGVEAVIDKDFASALLAADINADYLFILTGVEQVAIHFGTPQQQNLLEMTIDEALRYMDEGHFPKGSMGPKIEAAILFLKKGGKNVVITSIDKLQEALEGKTGTRVTL
ncbi:carbamate kinase [Rummeliibacillus sp. G93]|uniref:Carbamate kinase n=1 Tax=Rummeliibacillus stabekisii TaxID=241244 RepID=A0A143HCH2_9BACL|nr:MULTISPECIES: carbamate kinase [Rummeliibacillus]AMW98971.1 carbamate kinase [Rummeliibacillus stabekisii]MBB5169337.1 carbamate kinase [Rummeliibacillus stabekisii]MCM3316387.1 carbamate kinase [Rummeliibacillus stabekisii]UQW98907.1 carbamate kinase [Rummeliibacillus sp. G93]GEL03599.1 carbamate kinase [Rummeliibacillus stabekisii]